MQPSEVEEAIQMAYGDFSLDASFSDDENLRLLDLLEDKITPAPDRSMIDENMSTEIARALESLPAREQEVMSLYFGINRDRPCTLEEIGQHLGLTRERVRQIKEKALRRLRHASRAGRLRSHLY